MGLAEYKKKRNFKRTPEPKEGGRSGSKLRFVVQKHAASHLHFDFRLEAGGTLKSWAVPKGPSLDPRDKRLAISVEDHPISYRTFEGTIPEGSYGAGTVMVWDEGTYDIEEEANAKAVEEHVLRGIKKGKIHFTLKGKKLQGEFALVKLARSKEKNAWLLFKVRDEHAAPDHVFDERSAVSGKTMEEIGEIQDSRFRIQENIGKGKKRKSKTEKETRPFEELGEVFTPMLATLVDEPFDRKDWVFEVKWDGYRALAEIANGEARLYSRNKLSFDADYAPIVEELSSLSDSLILDGEIVVIDQNGNPNFQALQQYRKTGEGTLVYYVFDLLYESGESYIAKPLRFRRERLTAFLNTTNLKYVRCSATVENEGIRFFEAAKSLGLEGMVAKDLNSTYEPGKRSKSWLKIKAHQRQEAVICGFTEPRGSRSHIGALILGVYQSGKLIYAGHTGGGFTEASLKDMKEKLEPLISSICPFETIPKTNAPATWVKPVLVAEISFQEWTKEGSMRQPIFEGLRKDKRAKEVTREIPQDASASSKSMSSVETLGKKSLKVPGGTVVVSNWEKLYFPDEGYTKGDIVSYYKDIAEIMLPYLKGRPHSLNRHPNGIKGNSFFQKDLELSAIPPYVHTKTIHSESNDKDVDYLVVETPADLLYMANLGCIEINPWNSTVDDLGRPTYGIIDLDPVEVGFDAVIETAVACKEVLESLRIEGFPKTSGATGIHIYIPFGKKYLYEDVRRCIELLVNLVHQKIPEITSLERSPSKRRGKVYLDYLQNSRGQTLAAAYSIRPKPKATVSTPLLWSEVNETLRPTDFTIENIRERIDKKGDLWKKVIGKGITIESTLSRIEKVYGERLAEKSVRRKFRK